jgi:hypothetical protein
VLKGSGSAENSQSLRMASIDVVEASTDDRVVEPPNDDMMKSLEDFKDYLAIRIIPATVAGSLQGGTEEISDFFSYIILSRNEKIICFLTPVSFHSK